MRQGVSLVRVHPILCHYAETGSVLLPTCWSQVFWLSVWRGRATSGSELMNLRYRNERAMEQAAAAAAAAQGAACAAHSQAPPWVSGSRGQQL